MNDSGAVSRKNKDAYTTGAPGALNLILNSDLYHLKKNTILGEERTIKRKSIS